MLELCVCMSSLCVGFHLLTMTPYLSDLAVRLSAFHLISVQQTQAFKSTARPKLTHRNTCCYRLAFLISPIGFQKRKQHLTILVAN